MAKKVLSPIEKANKEAKAAAKKQQAASTLKIFTGLMATCNVPAPKTEWQFHPERKWALDYAWPEKRIALEIEGGVFIGGRHTSGMGFAADMVKYNQLTLLGWRLIRVQPKELLTKGTADLIRQLYNQ